MAVNQKVEGQIAAQAEVSRRDRILAAAAREFAEHGFAGARVERIAKAADVNKQLLFHYFGSKQGLHRAALGALLGGIEPAAHGGPPAARLREVVSQIQAISSAYPSLSSLLSSRSASQENLDLADSWRQRGVGAVRAILLDGQQAGHVRDDVDVDTISEIIVGASLGGKAAGGDRAPGQAERYRETLLKMVVDHCTWR